MTLKHIWLVTVHRTDGSCRTRAFWSETSARKHAAKFYGDADLAWWGCEMVVVHD